jgi:RsiW-degrading membrane proteinase PrsW (M82 family)
MKVINFMNNLTTKLYVAAVGLASSTVASAAPGDNSWLGEDPTGGNKDLSTITTNIDDAAGNIAATIVNLVTIGGFVVVALSLYQLYKASKDEREKPMSAVVGLFIGGAMAGVGTIMWIMRNTIVN